MGVTKAYMIVYNVVEAACWAGVLGLGLKHAAMCATTGQPLWQGLYAAAGDLLFCVQWSATLEVLHALLGLVKAPFFTTFVQVLSRVGIASVLYLYPASRATPGFFMLLVAWSLTEVVRYSYYALHVAGREPYPLLWLRYSTFLVLYPTGVAGELQVCWALRQYLGPDGVFFGVLPAGYAILFIICVVYPVGFFQLFTYMWSQRSKSLRAAGKKSTQPKGTQPTKKKN
eukprot:TRINITY_DN18516_c0_g1_i1.p1 TRINITY_DN18516_c0_g1~~TRINITY_DN18516_c0_g1_i1.p1  ORF type:complete len:228 (-),score=75.37 TRINITY_DN18516_c0_g1_i1:816-1499(-)